MTAPKRPSPDPYVRSGRVVRWKDADTVVLDLDLGFNVWAHNVDIRLKNCWADEKSTADGKAAKAFAEMVWPDGCEVIVKTDKPNPTSFGRYPGEVWGLDPDFPDHFASYLIEEGFARAERDPEKRFG